MRQDFAAVRGAIPRLPGTHPDHRTRRRVTIECACCGRRGLHEARGLISPCYQRQQHAGNLDDWPRRVDIVAADLAEIDRDGASARQVAARYGISTRTVVRYRARRRKRRADDRQQQLPLDDPDRVTVRLLPGLVGGDDQ